MAHADAHDSEGHDEAHDDHSHDEPPPPPEPATPLWLTLLGAALFVSGGVLFVLMTGDGAQPDGANGAAAKPDTAAHAAQPDPAAAQPRPQLLQQGTAPPTRPLNLPAMRPQPPAGGH